MPAYIHPAALANCAPGICVRGYGVMLLMCLPVDPESAAKATLSSTRSGINTLER